jgi:hypothetical protein
MLNICGAVSPLPSTFQWYGAELSVEKNFTFTLFKETVSTSHYRLCMMLVNDELEGMLEEAVVA